MRVLLLLAAYRKCDQQMTTRWLKLVDYDSDVCQLLRRLIESNDLMRHTVVELARALKTATFNLSKTSDFSGSLKIFSMPNKKKTPYSSFRNWHHSLQLHNTYIFTTKTKIINNDQAVRSIIQNFGLCAFAARFSTNRRHKTEMNHFVLCNTTSLFRFHWNYSVDTLLAAFVDGPKRKRSQYVERIQRTTLRVTSDAFQKAFCW